jgi:site-specific DNA-methyltransferase (adenine-specific)
MIEINKIYNLNCIDGFKMLSNESIDMILTSPPYDHLRKYGQNNIYEVFNENIWKKVIEEAYRVLKEGCVMVWVVGDATINGSETGTSFKQALYAKEIGFNIHDTMIYQKQSPIPQFKTHRYTNAFEYMFVFSKGKPIKGKLLTEPTKQAGRIDRNYRGQVTPDEKYVGKPIKIIKKEKVRTNIWTYSQNNGIDRTINHKAQFPEKLAEDHILSWSNEGDIILDPFIGSGTTAKMALLNNRKYIGFEINPEYCKIAEERIKKIIF